MGMIAAVACVALAGRLCYLAQPFDSEGAMFIYLGKSVGDGDRYCHEIIDNKFPSVGLLTSICWRAFGTQWPAYVLLQTLLGVGGALLLSRCAVRHAGPKSRLPAPPGRLGLHQFLPRGVWRVSA